jgi:5-methylcytosine-specific restriction endonuclease McrA
MYWNYGCPKCHAQTSVQWRQREIEAACRACGEIHYPPTPHEDHYGWVDGAEWPAEMAQAVEVVRGTVCAVTGCYKQHETLVHRRSLKSGGRTSVDNLMPLCKSHAESKGTKEYDDWLFEAKEQAAAERMSAPKFEITITAAGSGQEATGTAPSIGMMSTAAPILVAAGRVPIEVQPPVQVKVAAPFLRGPATRVVLDYDWHMKGDGKCKVFLAAWPRGPEPNFAFLGSVAFTGRMGFKEHVGNSGDKGNGMIEIRLPDAPGGRWTAAVAIIDQGSNVQLTEYAVVAS